MARRYSTHRNPLPDDTMETGSLWDYVTEMDGWPASAVVIIGGSTAQPDFCWSAAIFPSRKYFCSCVHSGHTVAELGLFRVVRSTLTKMW